jgi:hypothetical protein
MAASLYECSSPEAYSADLGLADLVEALSDTYLAWEDCHAALHRAEEFTRSR